MVAKLLIIAGSDSGGGAGIQADMKAASALGVYTATAITAITAQNTVGVQAVAALTPEMVETQITSVLDDIAIDAVKIGMLADASLIKTVARALERFSGPVVLDPVMIAKSGDALLADTAVDALVSHLLPKATVLTPNLPEAATLLQQNPASTQEEAEAQGAALRALGPKAVLMKGGHAQGADCVDVLVQASRTRLFTAPRIATRNTHGTGCSMSSAIAAEMAKGAGVEAAVARAHAWLHGAIVAADRLGVGQGHGPVHHFHELWP